MKLNKINLKTKLIFKKGINGLAIKMKLFGLKNQIVVDFKSVKLMILFFNIN